MIERIILESSKIPKVNYGVHFADDDRDDPSYPSLYFYATDDNDARRLSQSILKKQNEKVRRNNEEIKEYNEKVAQGVYFNERDRKWNRDYLNTYRIFGLTKLTHYIRVIREETPIDL